MAVRSFLDLHNTNVLPKTLLSVKSRSMFLPNPGQRECWPMRSADRMVSVPGGKGVNITKRSELLAVMFTPPAPPW
jgi:hypothetical protein